MFLQFVFTLVLAAFFVHVKADETCAVVPPTVRCEEGRAVATASPTASANISSCVMGCLSSAVTSANCSGITDVTCFCTSQTFQAAAAACLQGNCTASYLIEAEAVQSTLCSAANATTTNSGTTASATMTAGSSSATATTGNGAGILEVNVIMLGTFAGVMAGIGALL